MAMLEHDIFLPESAVVLEVKEQNPYSSQQIIVRDLRTENH